jgi:hypothetical protein
VTVVLVAVVTVAVLDVLVAVVVDLPVTVVVSVAVVPVTVSVVVLVISQPNLRSYALYDAAFASPGDDTNRWHTRPLLLYEKNVHE